jgi:hypothetical protein
MKLIVILLLLISCQASNIKKYKKSYHWVIGQYKHLSPKQKKILIESYIQGNKLKIRGERFGYTIATIVMVETSARRNLEGDMFGNSVGLTQMSLNRTKELLHKDDLPKVFKFLLLFPDKRIKDILKTNDILNRELCMWNFKVHYLYYKRHHYRKAYQYAVTAHNGINVRKGFYNKKYWNKFREYMRVVKLVIAKDYKKAKK